MNLLYMFFYSERSYFVVAIVRQTMSSYCRQGIVVQIHLQSLLLQNVSTSFLNVESKCCWSCLSQHCRLALTVCKFNNDIIQRFQLCVSAVFSALQKKACYRNRKAISFIENVSSNIHGSRESGEAGFTGCYK